MLDQYSGLSSSKVRELKGQFGPNLLPQSPPPTRLQVFLSQLKNPFIYVLIGATLVTLLIGHLSDALIIMLAVIINTILGYIQEYKANNSLAALTGYLTSQIKVIRDGKLSLIDANEIVPGDIVSLDAGSRIPADGIVLDSNRSSVNEALLTGESRPLVKRKNDQIFMGTILSSGQIIMRVEQIGSSTKMGEIAARLNTKAPRTPLERQLGRLSRQILIVIALLLVVVFALGLIRQLPLDVIFVTAVALAVSSIPEGLVVSLTIILAIGMQKIMRYRGLVRRLTSAETLGGVTVICLDKTGTLTTGELSVIEVDGDKKVLATQIIASSDHDDPLVIAAHGWAVSTLPKTTIPRRLDTLPFESKRRFTATLHSNGGDNTLYVSGAPETIMVGLKLSESDRLALESKLEKWAQYGHRVVAYAHKTVSKQQMVLKEDQVIGDLTLSGIIAFDDPVRRSVAPALSQAHLAGIRTLVITGDYAPTAQKILSLLGINLTPSEIMLGDDFVRLSQNDRSQVVSKIKLFARTTPDQKLLIVESLKANSEVVAMMGDGVNDAPALHLSDIGIVVGSASDVAKETADLILLDSNFATVIHAIREGRTMFDNLRKIILYLLCGAFAEIIVVIASISLGYPLPLTAAQILWINIVSDGFPSLALTIDPSRRDIMHSKPRSPNEPLLTRWMLRLILTVSIFSAFFAFISFVVTYNLSGDHVLARSVAFLTLGLNSLIYVFSVRLLTTPFWRDNLLANSYLTGAVLLGIVLQLTPFIFTPLRAFFGVVALPVRTYLIAFGLSLLLFIVVEIFKVVYHPHHRYTKSQ